MFEAAFIRPRADRPLDLGALAETLLFYGETRVLTDEPTLRQLIKALGVETFEEVVSQNLLKITYTENSFGIFTTSRDGVVLHSPSMFSIHKTPDHPSVWNIHDALPRALYDTCSQRGRARRVAARLEKNLDVTSYDQAHQAAAFAEIAISDYLADGVRALLAYYCPEYKRGEQALFHASPCNNAFEVVTDIDFDAANASYHRRVSPAQSSLSSSFLLSHFATVRADIEFASSSTADLTLDDPHSILHELRLRRLLRPPATRSQDNIAVFQRMALEGPSLREVINSGERSLAELLPVLQQASKFRSWLGELSNDAELTKEYIAEIQKNTWLEKLPTKSTRWAMFVGAGMLAELFLVPGVGTVVATGLSAADEFLLDKLLRGWKPNQFIAETLQPFLQAP